MPYHVKVCWDDREFQLLIKDSMDIPLLNFTGGRFDRGDGPFAYEKPEVFTLTQAIERAETKNFESNIEFVRLSEARARAQAAYANLLPHIRAKTVINMASPSPINAVAVLGDLLPFILPSRWAQAFEADALAEYQQFTYVQMQSRVTQQVETMAYTLFHHESSAQTYESLLNYVRLFSEELALLENDPLLERTPKAESDLKLTRNLVDRMGLEGRYWLHRLQIEIENDKSAISQTLGFLNPSAVQDLVIDYESPTIEEASKHPLSSRKAAIAAQIQTLNARQIEKTIDFINSEKIEVGFTFLDPGENEKYGLGLNKLPFLLTPI